LRNLICWSAFLFACLFAPADQLHGCSASLIVIVTWRAPTGICQLVTDTNKSRLAI
jgi:hypothetical protein